MGRSLAVCAILAFAGCQPLYGAQPERLRDPPKKKPPKEEATQVVQVKFVEECVTDFRGDPKRVIRNSSAARTDIASGQEALNQARAAKDEGARISFLKIGVDKLRNALLKDPYSADATLELALAYDRVLRKGCALKLLSRIAALEANDKFRAEAKRAADKVADTNEWFRHYRNEAKQAVGR
jgi:hypothetical protein